MSGRKHEQGELARRLNDGFEHVIKSVAEELSAESMKRILPSGADAQEVSREFNHIFTENCRQGFNKLLEKNDIVEKLQAVESSLGPTIKGKRYPAPNKLSPQEAVKNQVLDLKLAHRKALETEIFTLKEELNRKRLALEEVKIRARKTAEDFATVKTRFLGTSVGEEDAETVSEDTEVKG